MKHCPRCNQNYDDDNLNFCLNDGELLLETATSDAPPTLYMDSPRKTKENWPQYESPNQGQNQQIYNPQQPRQMYQTPGTAMASASTDNSLPTISLILGVTGILPCCFLGIPFGIAAVITGYIGYTRANESPSVYGGSSLAIIGMVLGGLSFILAILWILVSIATG